MNPRIEKTVSRHVSELRKLAEAGAISDKDHDVIGILMMTRGNEIIGLSPKAWETFKRIIDESRSEEEIIKVEEASALKKAVSV